MLPADATDDLTIHGLLGIELSVFAVPNIVVVEVIEQGICVNAHLSIEQAEKHIAHVQHMIGHAKRLAGKG